MKTEKNIALEFPKETPSPLFSSNKVSIFASVGPEKVPLQGAVRLKLQATAVSGPQTHMEPTLLISHNWSPSKGCPEGPRECSLQVPERSNLSGSGLLGDCLN